MSSVKNVYSYCNNENAVRFTQTCPNLSDRKINNSSNAETKLQIQRLVAQRISNGGTLDIKHVRSHANDSSFADQNKRKAQNLQCFRGDTERIEYGNAISDIACNHDWTNEPVFLQNCICKYVLEFWGKLILDMFHSRI